MAITNKLPDGVNRGVPMAQNAQMTEVQNSSQLFPQWSMGGKVPSMGQAPSYSFDWRGAQKGINRNANVGDIYSYVRTPENDPIYNYQKEEGTRALNAANAARGLSGSGAALEGNRRLEGQLLADQANRAREMATTEQGTRAFLAGQKLDAFGQAEQNAINRFGQQINAGQMQNNAWNNWSNAAQAEAQRLANMQQSESERLQNQDTLEWNKYGTLLDFVSRTNPVNLGAEASASMGNLYSQIGPQIVSYMQRMG